MNIFSTKTDNLHIILCVTLASKLYDSLNMSCPNTHALQRRDLLCLQIHWVWVAGLAMPLEDQAMRWITSRWLNWQWVVLHHELVRALSVTGVFLVTSPVSLAPVSVPDQPPSFIVPTSRRMAAWRAAAGSTTVRMSSGWSCSSCCGCPAWRLALWG